MSNSLVFSSEWQGSFRLLFFAGFIIAQALQRCLLHKRIALLIAYKVGTKPDTLILGFMIAVSFLSMWVSNTATTVMMLPQLVVLEHY